MLAFPAVRHHRAPPGLQPHKFESPPLRRERSVRPGALTAIDEGLNEAVTLLVAPSGWGKTTFLADWRAQTTWPSAWLSVHAEDCSPLRFVAHLCAAAQGITQQPNEALHGLLALPPTSDLTAILAEHLVIPLAKSGAQAAVIIDDYDGAAGVPEIAEAMHWLIAHMPSGLHLLCSSKSPGVFAGALGARRAGVRVLDLARRFDADSQAGLHLERLQTQDLEAWAPLAVVHQACDSLSKHLLGSEGAGAGLQDLANMTPLVGRVGQHSTWFGLHPRLRDALKERLTVAQAAELHLRAATWFFEQDYLHEAVEQLRLSGTKPELDLYALGERCLQVGRLDVLCEVLGLWPEPRQDDPRFALLEAWRLVLCDAPMRAQAVLREVESSLDGEVAAARAYIALSAGTSAAVDSHAAEAMSQAPVAGRAWAVARLAAGIRSVDRSEGAKAERLLQDAQRGALRAGYPRLGLQALCAEMDLHLAQGGLDVAERCGDSAQVLLREWGLCGTPAEATLGLKWLGIARARSHWPDVLRRAERLLDLLDPVLIAHQRPALRVAVLEASAQLPAPAEVDLSGLTERARGALLTLRLGGAARDAARRLGVPVGSAKLYIAEALEALQVSDKSQVLRALQAQEAE